MKNDDLQPGAVRRVSNQVSSPTIRPFTRSMPWPFSATARRARAVRHQRGISEPLQVQISLPRLPDELAAAQNLGREAVGRSERAKRCEGDRQLLVRRGRERGIGVSLEDDRPGAEVDGDRAGVRRREGRHLERMGEARRQWEARSGNGRRGEQQHGGENGDEDAHLRGQCDRVGGAPPAYVGSARPRRWVHRPLSARGALSKNRHAATSSPA